MVDTRLLGDPGTKAFQVEKYPFYLLNRLVSRYNVVIGRCLADIGLDIPSWRVLMILGEKSPRSIKQIAETAVVNLSTMTRIVRRMEAGHLITCNYLPSDNRVTEVSLSRTGRKKLIEARAATSPVYRKVIAGFSEDEFKGLIATLNRLHGNLAD